MQLVEQESFTLNQFREKYQKIEEDTKTEGEK